MRRHNISLEIFEYVIKYTFRAYYCCDSSTGITPFVENNSVGYVVGILLVVHLHRLTDDLL